MTAPRNAFRSVTLQAELTETGFARVELLGGNRKDGSDDRF